MGTPFIGFLRRVARLPLEAHLMIAYPDFFVEELAHASVDSFLIGGSNDLSRTIRRSKASAKRAGVAVDPATSATRPEEVMGELDQAVGVTVNFGFGHRQLFRPTMPKTTRARDRTDAAPLAEGAGSRRAGRGVGIFGDDIGIAAAMQGLRTAATWE
jgi:ribulose-phosphate 3-epimerase